MWQAQELDCLQNKAHFLLAILLNALLLSVLGYRTIHEALLVVDPGLLSIVVDSEQVEADLLLMSSFL